MGYHCRKVIRHSLSGAVFEISGVDEYVGFPRPETQVCDIISVNATVNEKLASIEEFEESSASH